MDVERGEDKQLDIIRWMGRVSSEGDILKVGLEITGGSDRGKFVEITAPTFPLGDGRFVIIKENMPILARYIPLPTNEATQDTLVQRIRGQRKQKP